VCIEFTTTGNPCSDGYIFNRLQRKDTNNFAGSNTDNEAASNTQTVGKKSQMKEALYKMSAF